MTDLFKPSIALRNPHLQTLLSYVLKREAEPQSNTRLIELPDQDLLALEMSTPKGWKPTDPTVLMLPGTAGSHQSPYLVRMANRLLENNIQAIRLNFRGIGSGMGHAKKISHGGASDELLHVIKALHKDFPSSPLSVIGFSLGGNILLKLAGENELSKYLKKIIAVCPPLSLLDSSQRLTRLQNRIYQQSIVKTIIRIVESPQSKFSYKPTKPLSKCRTLQEIDNLFTAPASGFDNAEHYYQECSCLQFIENITSPCNILFAQDDPLIDCSKINEIKLPQRVNLMKTRYGGHMGFLKSSYKNPFWMDEQLLSWLT
ncbi:MAG: hypothetical protein S4CHLAM6_05930 [Chlamydiae bacterium]|nr:hypothetical protein [Chlamydiota bacterium]